MRKSNIVSENASGLCAVTLSSHSHMEKTFQPQMEALEAVEHFCIHAGGHAMIEELHAEESSTFFRTF